MKNKGLFLLGFFIVGIFFLQTSIFILDEGKQAIVTQFGKPIGGPIDKAGPHFKTPFLQKVRYVDKRILSWDGFPNQIPTKDKKYISVDTTARWKIVDVLKFIQTVQNERGAKDRLNAILDSTTRDIISGSNLVEVVRNSNDILVRVEEVKKNYDERQEQGESIVEDEITGEIERIKMGRERLSTMIAESATKELLAFGIELVDVQLRRIAYEKSVEDKVYERMISERKRIAEKIRSIGQGEKEKIEGRQERDLKKIESEAYRKAQELKGKAEAEAIKIYAQAMTRGEDFYDFTRSMEAYKNLFADDKLRIFLSPDSEFFKYLKKL